MVLDPRGVRFAAALTSIVFVLVLVTGSGWLALAQAVVFALTAAWPRRGPYALVFRWLVAPRLGPPRTTEPAAPARFAQLVGRVVAAASAGGCLCGGPVLAAAMAAAGLARGLLNPASGACR